MTDVTLTAEWCEAQAGYRDSWMRDETSGSVACAVWGREAATYRLAARALRYAEAQRSYMEAMLRHDPCDADPPRHSPCSCAHCRDYKSTWPPMNQAKDALLTYAEEVAP